MERALVGLAIEHLCGELLRGRGQGFFAGRHGCRGYLESGRLVRFIGVVIRVGGEAVQVVIDGLKTAQHEAADEAENRTPAWEMRPCATSLYKAIREWFIC